MIHDHDNQKWQGIFYQDFSALQYSPTPTETPKVSDLICQSQSMPENYLDSLDFKLKCKTLEI